MHRSIKQVDLFESNLENFRRCQATRYPQKHKHKMKTALAYYFSLITNPERKHLKPATLDEIHKKPPITTRNASSHQI